MLHSIEGIILILLLLTVMLGMWMDLLLIILGITLAIWGTARVLRDHYHESPLKPFLRLLLWIPAVLNGGVFQAMGGTRWYRFLEWLYGPPVSQTMTKEK